MYRYHRPVFATYVVKDIFCVMEKPITNEHKNIPSRNNTPSITAAAPTPAPVNSKVYPKPKFLKFLQSIGAKGKTFSLSEILNFLKEYISSKQLFDQQNPWLVHCENDYLGSVFHCKQFTVGDVMGLINQNIVWKLDNVQGNEDESFDSDATEIIVSSVSDSDHEPPKKATPLDDIISSSTSESPKTAHNSTEPLLQVNSSFLEILQDVGAKGEMFKKNEIFRYLKDYVWSRRLFDPLHPWICLCRNDKLANVFRCDKFLISDVPHLVSKFCLEFPEYHPKVIRASSDLPPKTVQAVAVPLRSHVSAPGRTQSTPSDITSSTADVITPTLSDHIEHMSSRSIESTPVTSNISEESTFATPSRFDQGTSVLPSRFNRSTSVLPSGSYQNTSALPSGSNQDASVLSSGSKENTSVALSRSEESLFTSFSKWEENTPSTLKISEKNPLTGNRSEENGLIVATPSKSQNMGSDVPVEYEESLSVVSGRLGNTEPITPNLSQENELSASSSRTANSFTLTLEMKDDNEVLSFQSEDPVDDVYVEYEVMSNSSSFHMSESEDEHHEVSMDMLVICQDSDIECYADYSDTASDTDVELSEADKWCCSKCHLYNSPIHRLCDRCWTLRPGWLPDCDRQGSPKPEDNTVGKHKQDSQQVHNLAKRSLEKLVPKGNGANSSDEVSSDDSLHSDNYTQSLSRPSSPFNDNNQSCLANSVNLDSYNKTLDTLESRTTLSNICHFTESEVPARQTRNQTRNLKRNLMSNLDNSSNFCSKFPKMSSSPMKSLVVPGLCIICLHNPRDASLIHGASGHQICCLTCAKKLKKKGSKCPVCRQTIQKVVRNYLA